MSDKDFKLKSSSEGFDTRTKDIFANIDSLASTSKKQKNSEEKQPRKRITAPSPPPEDNCRDSDKKRTEEFKNCESIFRTPNESGWPPARSRHDRKRPHHGNQRFVFTNFWQLLFSVNYNVYIKNNFTFKYLAFFILKN
jgi:hypothetical protein